MPHHYDNNFAERVFTNADDVVKGFFKTLPNAPQSSPLDPIDYSDQPKKHAIPEAMLPTPDMPPTGGGATIAPL